MQTSKVSRVLTDLAHPHGSVDPASDCWMPRGLHDSKEAKLGECDAFVKDRGVRDQLMNWWLNVVPGANTPNWDIVSTCEIDGQTGLMVVEAKAHENELDKQGKQPGTSPSTNSISNHDRIKSAIEEANDDLNLILPGWNLSRDNCYQLSNRFAWSWKLATLGIPVVLVYLGFLNASDMEKNGRLFTTQADWEACVRKHGNGIVPDAAWNNRIDVNGTPIYTKIRSLELMFG